MKELMISDLSKQQTTQVYLAKGETVDLDVADLDCLPYLLEPLHFRA